MDQWLFLARNRVLSLVIVALLSFGGSWLFAYARGIPVPQVHDEYSYLLAGDTFAQGRVTNPPHPMWPHFETFHELMQPTYMSKYPPGQGLFLALGKIIFGHAIYGVWLSAALMCAAITWMLYAWLPARWALLGGLVSVLQFGALTYWSQSYWGGAVAALGAALVFGSLPRIIQSSQLRDVIWLGLGIALLLISRPVEGVLLAVPIGILILPWGKIKIRLPLQQRLMRIVVTLGLILMLIVAGLLAYNKNITKNAFQFPYHAYERQYSAVPFFIWQSKGPGPDFHHPIMAAYERDFVVRYFDFKRTWEGFWTITAAEGRRIFMFYFGYPIGTAALIMMLVWGLRRKDLLFRLAAATGFVVLAIGSTFCRAKAHYYAPLTCLAIFIIMGGLRVLSVMTIGRKRIGMFICTALLAFQLFDTIYHAPVFPDKTSLGKCISANHAELPLTFTREELKKHLLGLKGKHLVIISYAPQFSYQGDWVFNDPDIDHAPIVWARSTGQEQDAQLKAYYQDRTVWEVQLFWTREFKHDIRK